MQIIIALVSKKEIVLPIAYRHAQQSMIYNALRSSPEYSEKLHNYGTSELTTGFKLFTFGQFEGGYRMAGKSIIFCDRIVFEIRCHDAFMAQLLLSGFSKGKKVKLLKNELTVESCILENRIIFERSVTARAVSPITVLSNTSDGHTVYYTPDDELFYERILANAKRKWCTLYGEDDFDMRISPADMNFRKLVTLFKGTYINAWYGTFLLEGNPKVMDFLYNVGLGNKTSQGFGMFDLTG